MVQPLIIVIAIALVYWLYHIRKKGMLQRRKALPSRPQTKIEGREVQAYLSPTTPFECLRDDGLRFGKSFRLKHPPSLPHMEQCHCSIKDLNYSSQQVFDGALQQHASRESSIGILEARDAELLKKALKALYQSPLPAKESYPSSDVLQDFPESLQPAVSGFLKEGLDYHQTLMTSATQN